MKKAFTEAVTRRVSRRCQQLGLSVATWAPGDGVRRYRFFPGSVGIPDYDQDGALGTCLGLQEADVWLDGYAAARVTIGATLGAAIGSAAAAAIMNAATEVMA